MTLQPLNEGKSITGKLSYHDASHSWCVLRIKKELLNEFPDLRDRSSKFTYKITLLSSFEGVEDHVRRIKERGGTPPMLFWFEKVGNSSDAAVAEI